MVGSPYGMMGTGSFITMLPNVSTRLDIAMASKENIGEDKGMTMRAREMWMRFREMK